MKDLVFPGRGKAIFIHGCFWHGHQCARGKRVPKTNTEYWTNKIARNVARDTVTRQKLKALGWNVSVVWECQLKHEGRVFKRLSRFLALSSLKKSMPKI